MCLNDIDLFCVFHYLNKTLSLSVSYLNVMRSRKKRRHTRRNDVGPHTVTLHTDEKPVDAAVTGKRDGINSKEEDDGKSFFM